MPAQATGDLDIMYYDSKGNQIQNHYTGQTQAQAATLIAAAFAISGATVYRIEWLFL